MVSDFVSHRFVHSRSHISLAPVCTKTTKALCARVLAVATISNTPWAYRAFLLPQDATAMPQLVAVVHCFLALLSAVQGAAIVSNASCQSPAAKKCHGFCYDGVNASYIQRCIAWGMCPPITCDPIARIIVGESPIVLPNQTCADLGFGMGPAPHIPSKAGGDSFFGRHSTVSVWYSDLVALLEASRVLLNSASLHATLDNGAQWRKDNPQCDME